MEAEAVHRREIEERAPTAVDSANDSMLGSSMVPERESTVRSSLTVEPMDGKESTVDGGVRSSSATDEELPYKPLRPTRIDVKAVDVRGVSEHVRNGSVAMRSEQN